MQYRCEYSLRLGSSLHDLTEEIHLSIRDADILLHNADASGRTAKLRVSVSVNPATLSMRVSDPPLDGSPLQGGIEVPEGRVISDIMRSAVRLLAFILDTPIHAASLLQGKVLIPESPDDEARLQELGGRDPFVDLRGELSIRVRRFDT